MLPVLLGGLLTFAVPSSDPFAPCERARQEHPDDRDPYACYLSKARSAELLEQAAQRLEQLHDQGRGSPYATMTLGAVELNRGSDRARELLEHAAVRLSEADPEAEIMARLNLSLFWRYREDPDRAMTALVQAQEVARRSSSDTLGLVQLERARLLLAQQGSVFEIADLLDQAEDALGRDAPPSHRVRILAARAMLARRRGRYEEALTIREHEAALEAEAGLTYAEANTRYNLFQHAVEEHALGGWHGLGPIEAGRAVIELAQQAGNQAVEAAAWCELSVLLEAAEALEALTRCRSLAETTLDEALRFRAVDQMLLRKIAEGGDSLPTLADALAEHRSRGDASPRPIARIRALTTEAAWLRSMGRMGEAIATTEAAVQELERWAWQEPGVEQRSGRLGAQDWVHHQLVGQLLERGDPTSIERAFAVSERLRLGRVGERMRVTRAVRDVLGDHPRAPERDRLLETLSRLQEQGRTDELEATEARLERIELELEGDVEAYRRIKRPTLASLSEMRSALREDEAVIWFQHAPEVGLHRVYGGGAWMLVATRDAVVVRELPDASKTRAALRLWTGLLRSRDSDDRAVARTLTQQLLGSSLEQLPDRIDTLVLLPELSLMELPFGALVVGEGEHAQRLVERYDLSIAPSGTDWLRARQTSHVPATEAVVALADPVLTRDGSEPGWRSLFDLEVMPGPLPRARDEVQHLATTLGNSSVWLGSGASEARLVQTDLEGVSVLHLATHALVDEVRPHRSAVLLSPGSDTDDGLLQWREIAAMRLQGLVVLSACRSAGGKLPWSEGPSSLAQAFLHAGARTVVANLWPLRDDDAQALFAHFYGHLAQGRPVAEALSLAQRNRIAEGAPPEAWAGAIVLGDPDLVVRRPSSVDETRWWMWGGLAAFTAMLIRTAARREDVRA